MVRKRRLGWRVTFWTGTSKSTLSATSAPRPRRCWRASSPDGHWVFELEADATIPAEYVLLRHFLAEPPDARLERKIGVYLRRIQGAHGGWPLFHGGDFDISASVKAYFALKMIGDDIDAPHMARAREAILARGGAAKSNVFTRIAARAVRRGAAGARVPVMPVEIMLLPQLVPVPSRQDFVLGAHRDRAAAGADGAQAAARNPRGVSIDELFLEPPQSVGAAAQGAAPEVVLVPVLPRHRRRAARDRAAVPERPAQARDRQGGGVRHRAAQRRGRARRDLPGHGQLA